MKKYLLALCLFVTPGLFAYPVLWMGTYELSGSNSCCPLFGSNYRGEVYISPQGENFNVVWRVGSRQTQVGVGILQGDILSVAFTDLNSSSRLWGVVSYKVVGNGELAGLWTSYDGVVQKPEYLLWKGY